MDDSYKRNVVFDVVSVVDVDTFSNDDDDDVVVIDVVACNIVVEILGRMAMWWWMYDDDDDCHQHLCLDYHRSEDDSH